MPTPYNVMSIVISYQYLAFTNFELLLYQLSDVWSEAESMSTKREGLALVSLHGSIYALGGEDGVEVLNSVERLDPRMRTGWCACVKMNEKRRYFGCAALNTKIYVAGGECIF